MEGDSNSKDIVASSPNSLRTEINSEKIVLKNIRNNFEGIMSRQIKAPMIIILIISQITYTGQAS